MIYTITCNPAIDKTIINNETLFDVGGKGINVSKVLKNYNQDSICLGLIGKENKNVVYDYLDRLNIKHDFIEISGKVRTNTKIISDGKLVEENEKGPDCSKEDIEALKNKLRTIKNGIVVISGSAPKNIDNNFYKDLVLLLKQNNNFVILDCDKQLLKNAIIAKPDVIKPNKEEIKRLFNIEYDKKQIIDKCKDLDIDTIVVSLSEEGALFIGEEIIEVPSLKVNFNSPVGAGDSMVAAIAYCKQNNLSYKEMIKYSMAFSAAAVETNGSKPPLKERIDFLYNIVKV